MAHHVVKTKELTLEMADKAGLFAEVTASLAEKKINILALCAYGMNGKAYAMMVTSDNAKAKSVAKSKGWKVTEKDVVMVELKNEVGAAQKIAEKIKNINLAYGYGTTCSCAEKTCSPSCLSRMVLYTENAADKLVAALR